MRSFTGCALIERNLPDGMRVDVVEDGVTRVIASAAGLPAVARFVVGLGAAATSETPALAAAVRALAMGALGARAKKLARRSAGLVAAGGNKLKG